MTHFDFGCQITSEVIFRAQGDSFATVWLFIALLKKFTSKVDGFTFGTNLLMVITSEVKVFMTFWFYYVRRYYLLREVA